MRLHHLSAQNFRGFEALQLDFHPEVTVLVGDNGAGKTSVLEAVALILANVTRSGTDDGGFVDFRMTDARSGTTDTKLELELTVRGVRGKNFAGFRPKRDSGGQILTWDGDFGGDHELRGSATEGGAEPVVAYYGVERHARDATPGSRDAVYRVPRDAWQDAWSATSGFREFFHWFREREDIENAERVDDPSFREPQLAATRQAIASMLPGHDNVRVKRPRGAAPTEFNRPSLVVDKHGQTLAFDQLSGGERALVSLAGDIARRLAIANPHSDQPLAGEGVVLIDEVDLHLHPRWQAQVIPALRRTFPNLQLVVTTHSLVVLSYLPSDCIRRLQQFEVDLPPFPTQGRDPNALAIETYGVELRPQWVEAKLRSIAEQIDAAQFDAARADLGELSDTLGETDTAVVQLATALALEDV